MLVRCFFLLMILLLFLKYFLFPIDVREQCIWCLGNIAGDNVTFRDIILQQPDCLDALLLNIMEPASEALLRNSVWTLSNFCRGKPPVNFARLVGALPVLKHCIQNNGNFKN